MLKSELFDFLIIDWSIQEMDGLELTKHVRRNMESPNPMLPIIMLSGRAEMADVIAARDAGINEYVVKPFTSKTIYSRIERIIEVPRNFVVSQGYVGPDRRTESNPPKDFKERRVNMLSPRPPPPPSKMNSAIAKVDAAKVWVADYSLKNKLGHGITLQSLITPDVLAEAQKSIDAILEDSLEWIKGGLRELQKLLADYQSNARPDTIADEVGEVALTLNSRAGTFGYISASKVAYQLYLFCRNQLKPDNVKHAIALEMHIKVLLVIFGKDIRNGGKDFDLLVIELRKLCNRK